MADLDYAVINTHAERSAPDLGNALSTLPTLNRLDKIRLDIGISFGIRGTSSHFELEPFTDINAQTRGISTEFPIYHVNANYDMDSREWVSRLHATIYAAAARAVSHCGCILWDGTEHRVNMMPTLMVFAGPRADLIGQSAPTPVVALLSDHQFGTGALAIPFRERTERSTYQESSVHGKSYPTFNEGGLSCARLDGSSQVIEPKLIHIEMTPEEHFAICSALDKTLAWSGLTLFELAKVSRDKARENDCWNIAIKSAGQSSWVHTHETTAPMPAEYLYSQEVGRFFTNRLVKEALSLLKQAKLSLDSSRGRQE